MRLQSILSPHRSQLCNEYSLQCYYDNDKKKQEWGELLYRPKKDVSFDVESYFNSLSNSKLIEHDINTIYYLDSLINMNNEFRFSINISAISLSSGSFMKAFKKFLKDKRINPNMICLEITEQRYLDTLSFDTYICLNAFIEKGGLIALDDVGDNIIHFSLLNLELVNVLKFTKRTLLNTNKFHQKILRRLFDYAKEKNVQVIMECVECEEDIQLGEKYNIKLFQGLYFNP